MNVDAPPWLSHDGLAIYSIEIDSSARRVATAGSDSKVKIWNTAPLFSDEAEADEQRHPRNLATISEHTAPVNTVRFSRNGKLLASASDDRLAYVFELRPGPAKITFGTAPSLENWAAVLHLRGHSNNVIDIAWSPDNSQLATCSLDNTIIVWDSKGTQVAVLDSHGSYVKGVAWDPIGSYLASQSDDKSVIIWRCSDWTQITCISAPFQQGYVLQTFSLRLCWTTDGQHLVVPNCFQSPSYTAGVLNREDWANNVAIVGHKGAVTVISPSPLMYKDPTGDAEPVCCFAMGAQDSKVTVWMSATNRPRVILSKMFKQTVNDLAWSADGHTLLACSTDGRVAVMRFERGTLGEPLTQSESKAYLRKLYGEQQPGSTKLLAETAEQLGLEQSKANSQGSQPPQPASVPGPPVLGLKQPAESGSEGLPKEAARGPKGVSARLGGPEASGFKGPQSDAADGTPDKADFPAAEPPPKAPRLTENGDGCIGQKRSLERPPAARAAKAQRRVTVEAVRETAHRSPVALSGIQAQGPGNPNRGLLGSPPPPPRALSVSLGKEDLASGAVQEIRLEVLNTHNAARVTCLRDRKDIWNDSVSSPVRKAAGNSHFSAIALSDGTLHIYTPAGRRFLPSFGLAGAAAFLCCDSDWLLMAVLHDGSVRLWDLQQQRLVVGTSFPPSRGAEVAAAQITKNGSPLVLLSDGSAHTFHPGLQEWLCVAHPSFATSPFSSGMCALDTGELSAVESQAAAAATQPQRVLAGALGNSAADESCRHLEARIAAALLLESPAEYQRWLLTYVRHLAGGKGEGALREVCQDLLGPIRLPEGGDSSWTPQALGLDKRALLKDVIKEVARHRTHQRLVAEFREYILAAEEGQG